MAASVMILIGGCTTVARFTPTVVERTGPPLAFAAQPEFSEAAVQNGVFATKEQCDSVENALWSEADSEQACLRYWTAGFSPGASHRAVVFFAGDAWEGVQAVSTEYLQMTAQRLQAGAESWAKHIGVPYVFLARPGVYGSSGDHMQRRRPAESKLISAGLDQLKRKLGIDEFVLVGQSGGGHVTASLITLRSDVVCAVVASANSSPRIRWNALGFTRDTTGYDDSYEPHEHLAKAEVNADLRVFVLGDPNDKNAVWASQTVLADKLRDRGIPVEVLTGKGAGPLAHGLARPAIEVAGSCAKGASTAEILRKAAGGLRG